MLKNPNETNEKVVVAIPENIEEEGVTNPNERLEIVSTAKEANRIIRNYKQ